MEEIVKTTKGGGGGLETGNGNSYVYECTYVYIRT